MSKPHTSHAVPKANVSPLCTPGFPQRVQRVVSDNTHSVYKELCADQLQEFLDLVIRVFINKAVVPL